MKTFIFLLLLSLNGLAQKITKERAVIANGEWELIGDLMVPELKKKAPAVLMLNKANGDRTVYSALAQKLADHGVASLALDLRGHGESINAGKFIPGEMDQNPLIWDSEQDVIAAVAFLKSHPKIDPTKIGGIGGSYSGEELAEAGRLTSYLAAYVELSPGSFSTESILGIDQSNVPWFFVVCRDERYLKEITQEVRDTSESVELLILPGTHHATRILENYPEMAERIALWFRLKLN